MLEKIGRFRVSADEAGGIGGRTGAIGVDRAALFCSGRSGATVARGSARSATLAAMSSRPEPPHEPTGAAIAAAVRSPKKPGGEAEEEDDITLPPFDDEDEADESQLDVGDLLTSLEDEDADPFD